jgi:hypothetical protein
VEYLLKKYVCMYVFIGKEQSQSKREALWTAVNKATGEEMPKHSGAHITPSLVCILYMNLRITFSLLGFSLVWVPFFFTVFLFFPFRMGIFTLYSCTMDVYNFFIHKTLP